MPSTEVYDVTCGQCGTEATVVETRWPATRYDPPDGETSPEECPKCGKPWDANDSWETAEPPEPDLDAHFESKYNPKIDYPERYSDGPY